MYTYFKNSFKRVQYFYQNIYPHRKYLKACNHSLSIQIAIYRFCMKVSRRAKVNQFPIGFRKNSERLINL